MGTLHGLVLREVDASILRMRLPKDIRISAAQSPLLTSNRVDLTIKMHQVVNLNSAHKQNFTSTVVENEAVWRKMKQNYTLLADTSQKPVQR